jgi:uncharacterized membrane protein
VTTDGGSISLKDRISGALADPLADPATDRSRLRFAAMMVGIGVSHFLVPQWFERIIPRWFPWRGEAVMWSGVAEVASGALLAVPRTRRAGAYLSAATIVAVYPANIQMAIDATRGSSQVGIPAWAAWARLPLQVPMVLRAWSFTR